MNWGSEMAKKKDVRTRAEAKKLMWEYYRENKASLPKWIIDYREEVIGELTIGQNMSDVIQDIVESVDQLSAVPRLD